jgi:hypothetical protein
MRTDKITLTIELPSGRAVEVVFYAFGDEKDESDALALANAVEAAGMRATLLRHTTQEIRRLPHD